MARERRPSSARGHFVAAAYDSLRMQQWGVMLGGDAVDADRRVAEALDRLTVEEAAFVRALAADEITEPGCLVELIERRYGPYDHNWSPDDDDSPALRVVPESHPPPERNQK